MMQNLENNQTWMDDFQIQTLLNARWLLMGSIWSFVFTSVAFATFGWVAVSNILRQQGAFSGSCGEDWQVGEPCADQDKKLAFLFFLGTCIELLPAGFLYGPFLDKAGPKLASVTGIVLVVVGSLLLGFSNDQTFQSYIPAILLIVGGGAGIGFISVMHASNLWPEHSSRLVLSINSACALGATTPLLLNLIISSYGNSRTAYQAVIFGYAGLNVLFVPLFLWLQPSTSFELGEAYVLSKGCFKLLRVRISDLVVASDNTGPSNDGSISPSSNSLSTADSFQATAHPVFERGVETGFSGLGSSGGHQKRSPLPDKPLPPDAEAFGYLSHRVQPSVNLSTSQSTQSPFEGLVMAKSDGTRRAISEHQLSDENTKVVTTPANMTSCGFRQAGNVYGQLRVDVSIKEPRRYTEIRSMKFLSQIRTFEFVGMVFFLSWNEQLSNFWVGTLKTQLELKGDDGNFANLLNILVWVSLPISLPLTGWLLEKCGQASTLAVAQTFCMAFLAAQLLPSVKAQALTMVLYGFVDAMVWGAVVSIVGRLFGYNNFGKVLGLLLFLCGAFGLLNIPLDMWVVDSLNSRYWIIATGQLLFSAPLYVYCYVMWKREQENIELNVIKSLPMIAFNPVVSNAA